MKKKMAVTLCGILLFAMLLSGCGSSGGQAEEQGAAEQVSNEKPQAEEKEQEDTDTDVDKTDGFGKGSDAGNAGNTSDGNNADTDGKTSGENTGNGSGKTGSNTGNTTGGNTNNGTGGKDSGSGTSGSSAGNTSGGNTSNGSGTSGGNTGSTPSGNSNNGSGTSSGNTGNTSGATTPSQPEHVHNWVEETKTVTHEATGHYETKVIKDAWDEEIWQDTAVCGCGKSFSTLESWDIHQIDDDCIYGYSVKSTLINVIHHEAVTEQVWVEDSPALTETVGTGSYICSTCGATK